ncbi:LCP family protein [Cellulomonas sp. P24]|uniref:LCP family protein n=1 Tax=Cellulomonas sp. P24 TaxID=2885206 RepID=UPI00216AE927|nr:LCP family protein [Cellulomonas sp. P24]MCR6491780.1 LCP family protein [Cellulomonas sp. P24]
MLRSVALTLTAVLAFGAGGFATAYSRFQGNIDSADVTGLLGADRPTSSAAPDPNDPSSGSPVTLLLMGSDERDGANGAIGGSVEGMRSDTTIVLHISANRKRVEAVSIPRDSHVQIPACTMTNGKTSKPQSARFNAAFAIGADTGGDTASAAACAIKTVESLTGVRIDGFVVVDFVGFIRMVDALGGVPICIPNAMDSPKAGLKLSAGYQTLDGKTALAYARARTGTGVGDGSDTNRIGRQQQLLAATAREVFSKNLLTDVGQLLRFLDAATSSVTANPELASITNMAGLAFSLKDIPSGNITFMTVPFTSYRPDPNQVVWTSAAATIWANMASDRSIVTAAAQTDSTSSGTAADAPEGTSAGTVSDTPTTAETKVAGKEAFTPDDVTAVCG